MYCVLSTGDVAIISLIHVSGVPISCEDMHPVGGIGSHDVGMRSHDVGMGSHDMCVWDHMM